MLSLNEETRLLLLELSFGLAQPPPAKLDKLLLAVELEALEELDELPPPVKLDELLLVVELEALEELDELLLVVELEDLEELDELIIPGEL
jgi:hypothetical protein